MRFGDTVVKIDPVPIFLGTELSTPQKILPPNKEKTILKVEELHKNGYLDNDGEKLFKQFREKLLSILKNYDGIDEEMTDDQIQEYQTQREITSEEIRKGISDLVWVDVGTGKQVVKNLTQVIGEIKNHNINKAA